MANDPNATAAASAETPKKKKTVTVYAACHIVEDGNRYAPGEAMEVTEARAAALGDSVKASKPE